MFAARDSTLQVKTKMKHGKAKHTISISEMVHFAVNYAAVDCWQPKCTISLIELASFWLTQSIAETTVGIVNYRQL